MTGIPRRDVLLGTLTVGLTALTGCGSGPAPAAAGTDAGYPRTIRHILGETVLEQRPERVVTRYAVAEFDALVAVGVMPVAYGGTASFPLPWNRDAVARSQDLGMPEGEWSLEAVAAARPDLIIAQDGEVEKARAQLEGIAPTMALDANESPDWREDVRLVAQAVGRDGAAEPAIAETDAVIATTREALLGLQASTYLSFDGINRAVNGTSSGIEVLLREIGMQVAPGFDGGFVELSDEEIGRIGASDLLLVGSYDDDQIAPLYDEPLFLALPQVQSGRWAKISPPTRETLFAASVLSVRYGLPLWAEALLSASRDEGGRRF